MASSSNFPRSSSYDAWFAPQAPATTVTQHLEMDTPLPSIEVPNEKMTEVPDLAGRSRRQISPGFSSNDSMESRQRCTESPLHHAVGPPRIHSFLESYRDLQPSGINDFPPTHEDSVQLATPNPIVNLYTSEKKPSELIQGAPLPRADTKMYDPFIPPMAPEHQLITDSTRDPAYLDLSLLGPGEGTTSFHLQSAPVPAKTIPSLEGLGPKIWTGTHFLPRFVRAAEVPGEGLCYFYDDGSHCKAVIDDEAVNAHWGVIKSGKPRKRLAISCITCREEKIKCDPDYPRCVQCEKFGRICKFNNASVFPLPSQLR